MYNICKWDNIHIYSSGRRGCSVSGYAHKKFSFIWKKVWQWNEWCVIEIIRDIFNTKSNIVVVDDNTSINAFSGPDSYILNTVDRERTICYYHYIDVIMTKMASQITSLAVVYLIVYSGADQRKHQNSASLAFVRGIHRDRWIPRTKGQ